MYIKRKGLTANEVIKSVWNHIASTGEIPFLEEGEKRSSQHSPAFAQIMELRAEVPAGTPLDTLDRNSLIEELRGRDA